MTALRTIPCRVCSGTGRVEMENPYARLSCGTAWVFRNCPECEGHGSFDEEDAGEMETAA